MLSCTYSYQLASISAHLESELCLEIQEIVLNLQSECL